MTAQPTPEQREEWLEGIYGCFEVQWGDPMLDNDAASVIIDAIFAAGRTEALVFILDRIEQLDPVEGALAGEHAYDDVATIVRDELRNMADTADARPSP